MAGVLPSGLAVLVVPTTWLPKVRLVGVTVSTGAVPVPLSEMDCGLDAVLSASTRVPESVPREVIRQVCQAREVRIIRGAILPDYVHMLVAAPPQLAPAKLVQYIKGRWSCRLEEFPHLRKRYWGQHLWARGYFCETVGAVDEKTIMEYIESQKWDQDDQGFKITALEEP